MWRLLRLQALSKDYILVIPALGALVLRNICIFVAAHEAECFARYQSFLWELWQERGKWLNLFYETGKFHLCPLI